MNDGTVRDTRTELTRGVLPALTLMVLAPVIAEVLSASTRISFIVVLIPEILVWGGGALLIRELVRRWGGGWTSMWLLGLGLAIAEEFLIQQTSLAPLPWIGDKLQYGRMYGVNWIYFLYMLGYESVWVVLVPVQLTELIFPERREQLWLGTRGMVIVAILFLPGAFLAWFGWTQIARPNTFHVAKYVPPAGTMACGALAILLLGAIAYKVRKKSGERRSKSWDAPSAWAVGIGTMVLAAPWTMLLVLVFVPQTNLPVWIPMVCGIAWGTLAFLMMRRWAGSTEWSELHRWAVVAGAILVCMVMGYLGSGSWSQLDLVGDMVLNAIAAILLLWLRRQVVARRRASGG